MTEAARLVLAALARHDLDHADADTCQRLAALVLVAGVGPDGIAEAIDREQVALAGDPNTRLAAVDVVQTLTGRTK